MAKTIVLAGDRCCDLISYLSRILITANNSVLVVDISPANDYIHYLGASDVDGEEILEIKGISVTKHRQPKEIRDNYSIIIIYCGLNYTNKYEKASDLVVLSTSSEKLSLIELGKASIVMEDRYIVLCRDTLYGSYGAKYICASLGINMRKTKVYELIRDNYDYKSYLDNYDPPVIKFNKISGNFKTALKDIAGVFIDPKILSRIYKEAEKGVAR